MAATRKDHPDRTAEKIVEASKLLNRCRQEIAKRIVGQSAMIDGMLMALLSGGHVLLEGVPGLAKTRAVKALSETIDSAFQRIQFTPDLLPADLIGTMVYRQQTGEFVPRKGPIFSNVLLADEINRAPAKVQSALLEAMEEQQVTIGETTYPLEDPFLVLATQNPIEQEGTYPLPEAQLDRFSLKLLVAYPNQEEEVDILRRVGIIHESSLEKVLDPKSIAELRRIAATITVDERIEEYIVALIAASRYKTRGNIYSRYIEYGASPRGTIHTYRCAKIQALFDGRGYVTPDDVKSVVPSVLRHRIVLSYEAESEELAADDIVTFLLSAVHVP